MDSSGDIWKIIYLGFEKSQRSVTHDILRYINILTYLLTYLPLYQIRCKAVHERQGTALDPVWTVCWKVHYYGCRRRLCPVSSALSVADCNDMARTVRRRRARNYVPISSVVALVDPNHTVTASHHRLLLQSPLYNWIAPSSNLRLRTSLQQRIHSRN